MPALCITLLPAATTLSAQKPAETLYTENCAACHGHDGRGAFPEMPDIGDRVQGVPLEKLVEATLKGVRREGSTLFMPPRGGNPDLQATEIRQIIRYMKKNFR